MRCRVKNWSNKKCLFLSQKLVQVFFSLFVLNIFFFLQGEWNFQNKGPKRKLRTTISWVKTWSNYVAQHTWTNCWLNLLTFLGQFWLFKICWNHYFVVFPATFAFFKAHPPKLRKSVNTTALTEKNIIFSCIFVFCFCCVRCLVWQEWTSKRHNNWKQNNRKKNKSTRCKR